MWLNKLFPSIILTGLILLSSGVCKSDTWDRESEITVVQNYVKWFHRGVKLPKRLTAALEVVPFLVDYSIQNNIDPLLIAVFISCESSWRISVISESNLKEQGLMQVHGDSATKYDLSKPEEQIRAGVDALKRTIDTCGSIPGGISAYISTNGCTPKSTIVQDKVDYRLKLYKQAKKAFR